MNERIDLLPGRHDGVTVPRIGVTVALSVLIHILALLGLPSMPVQLPKISDSPEPANSLSLRLAPPSPPVPATRPAAPAQPAQRPAPVPRPPSTPPVIALNKPVPTPPQTTTPAPPPPAIAGDMDAYIEARRRARGDNTPVAPPPVEDEESRARRLAAGNLGSARDRSFGYDPRQGGGMFQIEQMSYDYASFIFYGWNNNISRNTKQLIEVRKGNNSDIRYAVVRKMIALIRENTQEDFLWVSQRLGRSVMLSARPRDNAGLEDFMMRDFFPDAVPARR